MARTVFILSASSDIGRDLMERYLAQGCEVIGTYRQPSALDSFRGRAGAHVLPLDLAKPEDFAAAAGYMRDNRLRWDLFVASNGTMEPIGPFLQLDGAAWEASISSNAMAPCRLLQALYPLRREGQINTAAFFAGGGTNNPFRNYSAYCLSKIMLIKMCELLDDEAPDLKAFILGPGYLRTKIHDETLRAASMAGDNLGKTMKFLETDGTPLQDIFDCLEWCTAQDRKVVGGRNFSVVHDPWRAGGAALAASLKADPDRYKLRRAGNS
ncbi:MAG TPA: SDR family NAD(P)-dependent oxidoreductase [Alphaproteobacteria bacterium]|nr:SDR family NAD(P)-dependent oxidoreductase [Alphaproteobacteria bacterium]